MTLDAILSSLFPDGHSVTADNQGLVFGHGQAPDGRTANVIGVANRTPLGIDRLFMGADHRLFARGPNRVDHRRDRVCRH